MTDFTQSRGAVMVAKLNLLLLVVLVACCGALASCAPGITVPERVSVEVPVACVKPAQRPERPEVRTEADLMNMPRGLRTIAAYADLKKYELYAAELEALVEGCSRLP